VLKREEELNKAKEKLKFYQLELVNRENNFNKIFNANPNVGVLDPFDKKKATPTLQGQSTIQLGAMNVLNTGNKPVSKY